MKLVNRRFMKLSYSLECSKLWFFTRSFLIVSIYTAVGSLQVFQKRAVMPDNCLKSHWSYMFNALYNFAILDDY